MPKRWIFAAVSEMVQGSFSTRLIFPPPTPGFSGLSWSSRLATAVNDPFQPCAVQEPDI